MAEIKKASKTSSISKTQEYLSRAFQDVTRGMPLAQRVLWNNPTPKELEGAQHYKWQVEMAHLCHEMNFNPPYMIPKLVADCNKLIDDIKQARRG